jgi:nucleoside-diphosphate-sugar epimerase
MSARRILVTGGSGFIGTNFVTRCLESGDEVVSADIAAPRDDAHAPHWRAVDILDGAALSALARDFAPTHLVHLAARTDIRGPDVAAYAANTRGVENVIAACAEADRLERVIFASSRMVCRIEYQPRHDADYCPPNAYGESKAQGEVTVRASSLRTPWLIVRPTSIWGPWFDIPYRTFFMSIYHGRYVNVRGHRTKKSFGFVGNTIYELDRLLSAPVADVDHRTLYLADYPPLTVQDFAEEVRRALGVRAPRSVPFSALRAAALVGDGLQKAGWTEPPLTSFRLRNVVAQMTYDLSPLEEIVGDLPYDMPTGVRLTAEWLRSQRLVS